MESPWARQPAREQSRQPRFMKPSLLTPTAKSPPPVLLDPLPKSLQSRHIARNRMVLVVAIQHLSQPTARHLDGFVHPPTEVLLHFLKLRLHPLPHGGPFQHKVTAGPAYATLVRKPDQRPNEPRPLGRGCCEQITNQALAVHPHRNTQRTWCHLVDAVVSPRQVLKNRMPRGGPTGPPPNASQADRQARLPISFAEPRTRGRNSRRR